MHSLQRRRLSIAAAASAAPTALRAQSHSGKPIRPIVPFPAAGATDLRSRKPARSRSDRLGQQVVVDNRPGAGGAIGSKAAVKSPADGCTRLLATSSTHSIGPQLNPRLPYDAQTDFTPVAHVANAANVPIVSPKLDAKNVREPIALVRTRPESLNRGSSGNGTIPHLTGERFKAIAGTYIVHIAYRGAALATAAMATGQVQSMFDSIVGAQPHLKDARVRPLAVTSTTRSPLSPEVVQKLNADIGARRKQAEFAERLRQLGAEPVGDTLADFARVVADDGTNWAQPIRERKIAADWWEATR